MKHLNSLSIVFLVLIGNFFTLEAETYTSFNFSEGGVAVVKGDATGYSIDGTEVTLNASGTYVFTGECSNGVIKVKKNTTGVKLVLSGLTLSADGTAPLCCNSGTQVKLLVQEGTTNTLADTATNNDELYPDNANAENAVIKLKKNSDVAIYGPGTLVVNAQGKNGIKSGAEAQLRIQDATLQITASVNDGISSDNLLLLESGNVTIDSVSEGIKCEPDEEDTASLGKFIMYGGNLTITSTFDGIDATGPVIFLDGTIGITTGGGYKGTVGSDDSKKGIKSATLLGITGGDFTMDCADDAFHTNDTLSITSGTFQVSTGDDAFHADLNLVLGTKGADAGPEVTIDTCYEGIEAAYIYLCSGDIHITASDDGVNAANSSVRDHKLVIYGGNVYCDASGDGFDSNNLTYIYGGDTQIFGSANGGNAALDSDGTIACHGGSLIAVGYSEMAQTPLASASTQSSISFGSSSSMIGQGGGGQPGMGRFVPGGQSGPGGGGSWGAINNLSIAKGNSLVVMDTSGNTLYTTTAVKTANHVVFTSEDLKANTTYYLYVNGIKSAQATAQSATSSSYAELPVPEITLEYTPVDELTSLKDEDEGSIVPLREVTLLTFSDTGITVTQGPDTAYAIDGSTLTITGEGTYEVTGACADGAIVVDKKVSNLTLLLNGLTLTSATTAPICIGKNADVTLMISGTNTLADNAANAENEKAVIKGKSGSNLTLSGTGALTLFANGKNGLKTGAEGILAINDIDLVITAKNDAISADHNLVITSGTFHLTAEGDAIKAEPDEEDTVSTGTIAIQGGAFTIQAGDDGIQSQGDLTISGGEIVIQATGCGINCGKACVIAADTETPRLVISASSTAIKAAAFTRRNAILRCTAAKSGILADSITLDTGTTELFVANEEDGTCLSPWTLTAGTLFVASNDACDTSETATCLVFQGNADADDTIAITDASGNTLLATTATQAVKEFLFADTTLDQGGTFTLWLNDAQTDTYTQQTSVTVSQAIKPGWNTLYLIVMPNEDALSQLTFYACADGIHYVVQTPAIGNPYFVYNKGDTIQLEGTGLVSAEILLASGWNFVGIPLSTDLSDDMIAWQWDGTTYTRVDILTPGKAYWIKQAAQ